MPESPRWLLRHGKYAQVCKVMGVLGAGDVTAAFCAMIDWLANFALIEV